MKIKKTCIHCKKEYLANSTTQKLCTTCKQLKIKMNCATCGASFYLNSNSTKEYLLGRIRERYHCSRKCVANDPKIKNKRRKTCKKNYGVDNPSQSKEIMDKKRNTCRKNYGVDYPLQSKIINERAKNTMLDKYGVDSYAKTDEYWNKYNATCIDKYGEKFAFQSEEVKEKCRQTWLDNYGVENPSLADEIKQKKIETCRKNFNVDYPMQDLSIMQKNMSLGSRGIRTKLVFSDQTFITRSFWETIFALYLYSNKLEFKYEYKKVPYEYENKDRIYFPDFFIPEFNYLVEIKGYDDNLELTKIKLRAAKEAGFSVELIDDISYFSFFVQDYFDLDDLRFKSKDCILRDTFFELIV